VEEDRAAAGHETREAKLELVSNAAE